MQSLSSRQPTSEVVAAAESCGGEACDSTCATSILVTCHGELDLRFACCRYSIHKYYRLRNHIPISPFYIPGCDAAQWKQVSELLFQYLIS